jgi:hypothetical protein
MADIGHDVEARLTLKAWTDAAFAESLRTDPRAAVERELRTALPADVTVSVLEETVDHVYLVIPAKPVASNGDALSDDELDAVAGAGGGLMQLVAYGAQDS